MHLKRKAKLPTVIELTTKHAACAIANRFNMGNYFNELRLKIIRANNLLQFINQITIEFRLQKSLAQEDLFRYQIIELSIKFRKGFARFMIPMALFKKFLS